MSRRLLVTAALPYANGPIHIGHLVEHIQTDIWVRFQRLRGHRCIFICADDTHGTATMIRARQEGRSEEAVITDMNEQHRQDFAGFDISFDQYGTTHCPENEALCHVIWARLREADLVVEREVTQLYDPVVGTFLADRFVRGTCPKCGATDEYGDSCSVCGSTYAPTDLKDPRSTLSGATPEVRSSPHQFVRIEPLRPFLVDWTQGGGHLGTETANYLKGHFLGEELRDWDVSRPAPYFGFEIPDVPGHYWYVWFDAPTGYIANTKIWCERHGESLDEWWRSDDTEIHHFIGKDIVYFHCLFWPSMLKTAGFTLPKKVHVHGMLTVDGAKMSKSKGTSLSARTWLEHVDADFLRYFYASKLGTGPDDFDLGLDEFVAKVNSDLIGKIVNLPSRTAKFVGATGLSAVYPDDGGLFQAAADAGDDIAEAYEEGDYQRALKRILALADRANEYVEKNAPWTLAKAAKTDPTQAKAVQDVCTVALNLFRQVAVYLAPVLPSLASRTSELLGAPISRWVDAATPLLGTPVARYEHWMKRVERTQLDTMIEASREAHEQASAPTSDAAPASTSPADDGAALAAEPVEPTCTIDDVMKVDLRVARVVEAAPVEGADKLLQLTLSLGGEERRNVFAGIKSAYKAEDLVGRLVVCVANLQPRKMRFGTSEGMVVAAGPGGQDVFLLSPDSGAVPGQRVR